jgi:hypothetical protein
MTKKGIVLIVVAVVLAAVYVTAFTDWFHSPQIQILPQIRPVRPPKAKGGNAQANFDNSVYPVSFMLDRKHGITELRVVAVADEKTNKYPHALWHMISDSNSVPVKALTYGAPLPGMKPKTPKARPEPLEPNVPYHLYVEAGNFKGNVKFQTHETVAPGAQ